LLATIRVTCRIVNTWSLSPTGRSTVVSVIWSALSGQ